MVSYKTDKQHTADHCLEKERRNLSRKRWRRSGRFFRNPTCLILLSQWRTCNYVFIDIQANLSHKAIHNFIKNFHWQGIMCITFHSRVWRYFIGTGLEIWREISGGLRWSVFYLPLFIYSLQNLLKVFHLRYFINGRLSSHSPVWDQWRTNAVQIASDHLLCGIT